MNVRASQVADFLLIRDKHAMYNHGLEYSKLSTYERNCNIIQAGVNEHEAMDFLRMMYHALPTLTS